MDINKTVINQILDQAPKGTTAEQVEQLYTKYEGNSTDILINLWNIEETKSEPSNISVEELEFKKKISEVRDICNAFDEEMENYLQQCRVKQQL